LHLHLNWPRATDDVQNAHFYRRPTLIP
jgi:hypothetical protein